MINKQKCFLKVYKKKEKVFNGSLVFLSPEKITKVYGLYQNISFIPKFTTLNYFYEKIMQK